ncbi:MAG: twin-arginine translocation signal domain-containing protein [Verrucomicrobiota bacterium JB022]|nr:twin-arginine translocation signal domain-containing protein [Verrucomicrobiota bacterium JB022]
MKHVSRRDFVKFSAVGAAAAWQLAHALNAQNTTARPIRKFSTGGPTRVQWLEAQPKLHAGTTWGLAWPRGQHRPDASFAVKGDSGQAVPVQTWPTAYWPDGSVKWTAHAIPGGDKPASEYSVTAGASAAPKQPVKASRSGDGVVLDNGLVRCVIPLKGDAFISVLERGGQAVARDGHLVGMVQDSAEIGTTVQSFRGKTQSVEIEQDGPVRAVVKIAGQHVTDDGRSWLPYVLRVYLYAGAEAIRVAHTFVFDGDEEKDFLRGLGVRFAVPMRDEAYDRHIRFAGEGKGLWAEAVQGITGLRRDPGEAVRQAQIDGKKLPPLSEWAETVSSRLHFVPKWGDFTLSQLTANGFQIRKRTQAGYGWIDADQGHRAAGLAYIGGASGGLAFGMRDFWQLHPVQLDVRDAETELAQATVWMYSPEAPPMDIRFYHSGEGQESYEAQLDALNITYEDYEPGFGTPHGVARTTDLMFWALPATPSRERLVEMAGATQLPPVLVARPEDYLKAEVFGALWSLPDRSSPAKAKIEDRLEWSVDYYKGQIDQRHWYGFWNYGDVMHTYDHDRHVWRYDIGGYAWDNSELSPDLWLWYSFLRSGRAETFRIAEAMTRHNRDVDIYHLGRFQGFGTRHNVQHWGCSAKQLRISTAAYRRFHYFLTGDERTGDVLEEVAQADRALAGLKATRKLPNQMPTPPGVDAFIGVGTDWGSAAANWLTALERTQDEKYRVWLEDTMRTIGSISIGFFNGGYGFNVESKELIPPDDIKVGVSHLSAVFGLTEMCAELIQLFDVPEFKEAWLQYCTLYNASGEEQQEALGTSLRGTSLRVAHSRLTAYAAKLKNDPELGARAWKEFYAHEWGPRPTIETRRLTGPAVLNPIDEAAWVSTNDSAQWGLAAIQNLALVPDALPRS